MLHALIVTFETAALQSLLEQLRERPALLGLATCAQCDSIQAPCSANMVVGAELK